MTGYTKLTGFKMDGKELGLTVPQEAIDKAMEPIFAEIREWENEVIGAGPNPGSFVDWLRHKGKLPPL